MNTAKKACFYAGIVLLFIKSAYSLNLENTSFLLDDETTVSSKKEKPSLNNEREKSFWEYHQSNWKKTENFNKDIFWDQKESISIIPTSSGNTVSIRYRKISSSTNDSFEQRNGFNGSTKVEYGDIRYKGYRFNDLNIPAGAKITNVQLFIVGYTNDKMTINVKAENKKSPSAYTDANKYLSTRPTTTKSEDWNIPKLKKSSGRLGSPNLKDIVQEVIDNNGGATHLSFIVSSEKEWISWNFDDGSSSHLSKINISYTIAGIEAVNDTATTDQNKEVSINILNNDNGASENGKISITNQPTNGSVTINNNNTSNTILDDKIVYTPNTNYSGSDSFTYKICDNNNQNCDTATVSITINETIDPCDAAASGNLDTDNDGISDICDLDDDNDGILDCVENGLDGASLTNVFDIAGSAKVISSSRIELTPESKDKAGSSMSYGKIDFQKDFDFSLKIYLGNRNDGADGLAIVFHNDPNGSKAVGESGSGIGARKIKNGIALEFDTYRNGGEISNDHTQILSTENFQPLTSVKNLGNIEDGKWHEVNFNWNATTKTLSYSFDGNVMANFTNDLVKNYFDNSSKVHFGFTASTGGKKNRHLINFTDGLCSYPIQKDTDNDGIINSKDTDSDNDGCPDATEAANNLTTIATLNGGSNGGSSDNLGIQSNNKGIPIPLGTANGNETTGQNINSSVTTAEKITASDLTNKTAVTGENSSFTIEATSVIANTYTSGSPNYNSGTDSTETLTYKWYKTTEPNTTLSTTNTITFQNLSLSDAGDYIVIVSGTKNKCSNIEKTVTLTVNNPADPCDAAASGNIDTDNDGISDICDLDDDNDGILDVDESSCDQTEVANSTSGRGEYQDQLYFFNWSGSDFSDGIQNGDSQTFNLPGNLKIVATFSNVVNANSYKPNDLKTYSAATLHQLYNTDGNNEALYGGNNKDASFTVNFDVTKNGEKYPIDLLTLDAESTHPSSESIQFTTNGEIWKALEKTGNGGIWSGIGTKTVKAIDTENSGGNTIFYSFDATKIDININAGGREAVAFGIWLKCDTDNDGILNQLDTDSDNDGCPDATEGAKNLTTTATLNGGSIGGSSANLGTTVNKNGIPLPLVTANGDETTGQATSSAVIIAEKTKINNALTDKTVTVGKNLNITIDASSIKTEIFDNGTPDFTGSNGVDSSDSIIYNWYKNTDPETTLSTSKTLTISEASLSNAGDYTVIVKGANYSCTIEDTFTLTVNDLPVTTTDTVTVDEDSSNNIINVLDNDSFGNDGANTGAITITNNTSTKGGTISVNDNNTANDPTDDTIIYSPETNFNGIDTFEYTITDANGDTSTATVKVTVNSVNDTPLAQNDTATVDEDSSSNTINVLDNDSFGGDGSNSGSITLSEETSSQGGTISVNKNGTPNNPKDDTITYTPAANFNGTDTFSYTITDANGDTTNATATITVTSINDTPTANADTATVDEDSSSNPIFVLDNDNFGGDGTNSGTISLPNETSNQGGTISVNDNSTANDPTDDSLQYTPAANFNGTDSFSYTITDANGDTSTATVTVTVNSVNDTPTATADTATVDEDSTANSIDVLDNDSFGGDGSNSGAISLASGTSSKGGTISVDENGTPNNPTDDKILYAPKANYNGSDSFEYTITDANGDTSTATVTINVSSINDFPTAGNDTITVDEDSSNNIINFFANDSFGGDGFSTTTRIKISTPSEGGTITINVNNTNDDLTDDTFKYTPKENFNGVETFTYTITDANGDEATGTVTVTVTSVNDTPTANTDTAAVEEDSSSNSINVLSNDTFGGDGANTGAISIASATSNQGGTISVDKNGTTNDPTDDKITYSPAANFNGTDTFDYTITDADGDTSTATVTITVDATNDLPVATADTATVDEDSTSNTINVLANDTFGGDGANTGAISIVSGTSNEGGTVSVNDNNTANDPTDDTIVYTPATNFNGTDTFSYTITDANGDTSTVSVTVTVNSVNDLPVATADTITVDEDSDANTVFVLDNDDFGGDGSNTGTISIPSATSTNGGTITIADNDTENDPTDDTLSYTPAANFNGSDTFSYTITDANGDTSTATVTVTVNSINDVPTATADTITVDEDSTSNTINVLTNDTFGGDNANSGAISISSATSTNGGIISVNKNNTENDPTDDSIIYTPAVNFNGTDTFSYTITDANGDTSSAIVTVTVTSVNDTPTATADSATVDEDSTSNIINVLTNDDFGGDNANSRTITLTSETSNKNGTLSVDDNNTENDPTDDTIIYTPVANFNGTDTFEYTITDADGDTSTATVTVTVNSINDLPTATADTITVDEDSTSNNIFVLDNDTFGGDGPNSGKITVTNATSSQGGIVTVDDNNTATDPTDDKLQYSPAANFNGTDTFEYTITDANGDTSSATVTVTITSVNDIPTATADTITVDEDSTSNTINVLTNDTFGGDNANTGAISISNATSEKGGTISVNKNGTENDPTDDTITYTPAANYNGIDSFEYTITDADGDTSTATVSVTVNSVNDNPVATADTATVDEDSSLNIINVLINDTFGGDGENQDGISLPSTTSSKGGIISVNKDDTISYTPADNFNGTDTFDYTIKDLDGDTSTVTVTITVVSVNDLPTANADTATVDEDSTANVISVITNDDFGGDGPSAIAISSPNLITAKEGTISINNNNTDNDPTDDSILYTPAANFNGVDFFEYTITDANGDEATIQVSVTVNPVNDIPTANNDVISVDEDSTNNTINVVTNDDFGGDGTNTGAISLASGISSQKGTIVINDNSTSNDPTDDSITYTPVENFNGTDTFEYTITDANGDTSTATVTITVNSVNDLPAAIGDTASVDEDSSNNSISVLNNDSFGGDGANTDAISLPSTTSTNGGTISVNKNGTENDPTDDTLVYTPNSNFTGTDIFDYTITDANGDTSTAQVAVTVNATGKPYNPTSGAECFNVFVENNLSITSGNTIGSIAAGGNLNINGNYNAASDDCGCFDINQTKIGLLVNGKVNYSSSNILSIIGANQYAKIGNANDNTVWYQDPANSSAPIRITASTEYEASSNIQLQAKATDLNVSLSNNPVFQENVLDFSKAFQNLRTNATSLSKELTNIEFVNENDETIANTNLPSTVNINLYYKVNYLNITADDLNNVDSFTFNQEPNANLILIINVDAAGTFNWDVWSQTNATITESPYILYNFYNTTELNIIGSEAVAGTIFAPFADITKTVNKANILGQVIGKSLNHDGGEIQCSIFDSNVYSPKDVEVAPTADFTTNDDDQCFVDNKYVFTNTSNTGSNTQPTAPISYSWDFGDGTSSIFMNPTKTYSEGGTYTVKLTATNTYGSSTKTKQVTVTATTETDVVESNSTIDEDAGTVTKEFTLNNDSDYSNFSWAIESVGSSLFENEKTVSFEFSEEGEYTLTLTVINNNCSNTTVIPITITSDEVSTGNDGGLESESLGDALSIRYFQRKKKSIPTIFRKTNDIIYNKSKMVQKQVKKSNDLTMLDMFPDELLVGDIAHVTSPTDILDFTVADEVLSIDYSIDDKTIGVILGVKTIDQIYNHTKATCDRLRGAEILNVKTIEIEGYNFLIQAIKQRSGVIEHAISFAVGKNATDDFYTIQTNWYVFDYTASNDVFNFQVWASEPANTEKMVKDILANLNNYKIVEQTEKQKLPRTYATKVSRELGDLIVNLKSLEENQNLEVSIEEKLNETTTDLNLKYNPLNTEKAQSLTVKINDGYEYDGDIKFDGEVQDAFYHADGNWGLDYDRRYTTVSQYEVSNNFNRIYKQDELPINRNIHVKAYSEYDYLAVYKALLPGTIAADYTNYNYLSFKAKGVGQTRLTLIKSSIENWQEQYTVDVVLTEEEQTFFIPFDSFKSTATNDKIVADDLTTISFTYIAVDAGTNDLDMKISDVKFTEKNTALSTDEFISPMKNEFIAYPNPTNGKVNCVIQSDFTTEAKAILYDITGKTISENPINLIEGKNELNFNFRGKAGVMFLKIISPKVNYGTTKIVFK